jgi:Transglutaminase-like enzymes, putative cysteine proteases
MSRRLTYRQLVILGVTASLVVTSFQPAFAAPMCEHVYTPNSPEAKLIGDVKAADMQPRTSTWIKVRKRVEPLVASEVHPFTKAGMDADAQGMVYKNMKVELPIIENLLRIVESDQIPYTTYLPLARTLGNQLVQLVNQGPRNKMQSFAILEALRLISMIEGKVEFPKTKEQQEAEDKQKRDEAKKDAEKKQKEEQQKQQQKQQQQQQQQNQQQQQKQDKQEGESEEQKPQWNKPQDKYKPEQKDLANDGKGKNKTAYLVMSTAAPYKQLLRQMIYDNFDLKGWNSTPAQRGAVQHGAKSTEMMWLDTLGDPAVDLPLPYGYTVKAGKYQGNQGHHDPYSIVEKGPGEFVVKATSDKPVLIGLVPVMKESGPTAPIRTNPNLMKMWPASLQTFIPSLKNLSPLEAAARLEKFISLDGGFLYYSKGDKIDEKMLEQIQNKYRSALATMPEPAAMAHSGAFNCDGAAWIGALILRDQLGIPTRIAGGRTAPVKGAVRENDNTEYHLVKSTDPAHAWLEVFDGTKWVPFDMTPKTNIPDNSGGGESNPKEKPVNENKSPQDKKKQDGKKDGQKQDGEKKDGEKKDGEKSEGKEGKEGEEGQEGEGKEGQEGQEASSSEGKSQGGGKGQKVQQTERERGERGHEKQSSHEKGEGSEKGKEHGKDGKEQGKDGHSKDGQSKEGQSKEGQGKDGKEKGKEGKEGEAKPSQGGKGEGSGEGKDRAGVQERKAQDKVAKTEDEKKLEDMINAKTTARAQNEATQALYKKLLAQNELVLLENIVTDGFQNRAIDPAHQLINSIGADLSWKNIAERYRQSAETMVNSAKALEFKGIKTTLNDAKVDLSSNRAREAMFKLQNAKKMLLKLAEYRPLTTHETTSVHAIDKMIRELLTIKHENSKQFDLAEKSVKALPGNISKEYLKEQYGEDYNKLGAAGNTKFGQDLAEGKLKPLLQMGAVNEFVDMTLNSVKEPRWKDEATLTKALVPKQKLDLVITRNPLDFARMLWSPRPGEHMFAPTIQGRQFSIGSLETRRVRDFQKPLERKLSVVYYDVSGSMGGARLETVDALLMAYADKALSEVDALGRPIHEIYLLPFSDNVMEGVHIKTKEEARSFLQNKMVHASSVVGGTDIQKVMEHFYGLVDQSYKTKSKSGRERVFQKANMVLFSDGGSVLNMPRLEALRKTMPEKVELNLNFVSIGNEVNADLKTLSENKKLGSGGKSGLKQLSDEMAQSLTQISADFDPEAFATKDRINGALLAKIEALMKEVVVDSKIAPDMKKVDQAVSSIRITTQNVENISGSQELRNLLRIWERLKDQNLEPVLKQRLVQAMVDAYPELSGRGWRDMTYFEKDTFEALKKWAR